MKKTLSMILALIMLFSMLSVCVYAQGTSNDLISRTDIQLLTSDFVLANITGNPDCTWNTEMSAIETPLYDGNDNIVAYYVAFNNADGKPNGYLVINASQLNPSVIEYGFGTDHDDLVSNGKTYYATFGVYYSEKDIETSRRSRADNLDELNLASNINSVWDNLNIQNTAAQNRLNFLQSFANVNAAVQKEINIRSTNSWGISDSLPSGNWSSADTLTSCLVGVPYHTTYEFQAGHTNHCGATAALNVLKYYGARLNYDFIKPDPDPDVAFEYLYANSGNGDVTLPAGLIRTLKNYISNRKSAGSIASSTAITTEQYTEYGTYRTKMVSCVNNGKMPLLMIWSLAGAHWVNVVAYYTYSNGNTYVRLIDNWNTGISRYYVFESAYEINSNIGGMISVKITK